MHCLIQYTYRCMSFSNHVVHFAQIHIVLSFILNYVHSTIICSVIALLVHYTSFVVIASHYGNTHVVYEVHSVIHHFNLLKTRHVLQHLHAFVMRLTQAAQYDVNLGYDPMRYACTLPHYYLFVNFVSIS